MEKAIEAEVEELCPDCEVSFEDAQIPSWFDGGLENSARNKVAAKAALTHMLPIYDAMTLAVDPAVAGSGKEVAVGSFNATPAVMQNLASGSSAIKLDVGCPNDWFSLATADATFRLLAGEEVPDDYGITCRVFDERATSARSTRPSRTAPTGTASTSTRSSSSCGDPRPGDG